MRVLVTGANGLLGRKLADLIKQEGVAELLATNRATLDVTNAGLVKSTIQEFKPGVIINAAAMTQVDQCEVNRDECWKQNVTSVQNLVDVCVDENVHLVHVSTDFIFNGKEGPLDETAVPDPVNFYGESKLEGERIILSSKCPAAIIRTVLVYGVTSDMSRSNIVLWVKKSLEVKKAIKVVNNQFRTPTLAEDLAMGCWLAARKKSTGIFHVSGHEMMTPYEIALRTAEFFGLDKSLISSTEDFVQPAKRPLKTGFIIEKARKELGYQPHSFDEGLEIVREQLGKFRV
ncbi:MAG TPA: NAD(P)-dependent oxidoreductase [Cyclobacteriaceae bacterium]